MGVAARAGEVVAFDLPRAEVRKGRHPPGLVAHRSKHAVGHAVARNVKLPFEQSHPEGKIDEVVVIQVCRKRALQALTRPRDVPAHERAPDEELDRLRCLAFVPWRGGVGPLERPLRRLGGAEAIEHPRQDALDASSRVGPGDVARLDQLLQRLVERSSRGRQVALVMHHVADRQEKLAAQRRVVPRVGSGEGVAQVVERDLGLLVPPFDARQGQEDGAGLFLFRGGLEEGVGFLDAPFPQLDLAHDGADPSRARMNLARQCAFRRDVEQRLRRTKRSPGGLRIPRVLLARHRIQRQRQGLADEPRLGVRLRSFREDAGRGLGHAQLFEGQAQRDGHVGHRRVEPITLAGNRERRGAEDVVIFGDLGFVLVRRLSTGERAELVQEIDASLDVGLLGRRLDGRRKLRALGLEELAGLSAVERRESTGSVGVTQVDGHEHRGPRLEGAPGFRSLLARRLHVGDLPEPLSHLDRATDPLAGRIRGVRESLGARLEHPPVYRDPLEPPEALERPAGGHGVLHPPIERPQVRPDFAALGRRRDSLEQIVDCARPAFVALEGELPRGCSERLDALRPEDAFGGFADMKEVKPPADRREPAVGRSRPEPLRCARHLPPLDGSEAHAALCASGRAQQKVVHRGGEAVVVHHGRRRGRPLCIRRRRSPSAMGPAAREPGRGECENERRSVQKSLRAQRHGVGWSLHSGAPWASRRRLSARSRR